MAITRNAHNLKSVNNGSPVNSDTVQLTGVAAGDLITVEVGIYCGSLLTLTVNDDVNTGNYATANTAFFDSFNGVTMGVVFFTNSKSGTVTITVAWSGGTQVSYSLSAQSWSGAATSSPQDSGMTQQNNGSLTNPTSGTAKTPAVDGEVVIGYLVTASNTPTAGASYALTDSDAALHFFPEYWIQTTATATNTPYTVTDTVTDQMVAFKPLVTAAGNPLIGVSVMG
jgi:hypothetical protein